MQTKFREVCNFFTPRLLTNFIKTIVQNALKTAVIKLKMVSVLMGTIEYTISCRGKPGNLEALYSWVN